MINDFSRNADLMAYFYFWSQRSTGRSRPEDPARATAQGSRRSPQGLSRCRRPQLPRMANFSFDYGDVHWMVLDANPYVQWADVDSGPGSQRPGLGQGQALAVRHLPPPGLQFVEGPRARAADAPSVRPFRKPVGSRSSSAGNVHNYQRTYPLKFAATTYPDSHAPGPPRRRRQDHHRPCL